MEFLSFSFLFLSGTVNLFLALLIFSKHNNKISSFLYALLTLFLGLWSFSVLFPKIVASDSILITAGRISHFTAASSAFFFFLFAIYFPDNIRKIKPVFIYFVGVIYILLAYLCLFSSLVVVGADNDYLIYGPLILPYGIFLSLVFLIGYLTLTFKIKFYSGLFRGQLTYIIAGASITFFIGFIFNFVLTRLGSQNYNWVGPSSSLIVAACAFYAITHYRLMGIKFLASKLWSSLFIVIFSFITFYAVHYVADIYLERVNFLLLLSLGVVFAFFYVAALFPLLEYAQKSSDEIFYRGIVFRKVLKDLFLELNQEFEIKKIYQILAVNLKAILSAKNIHILTFISRSNSEKLDISKNNSFNYFSLPENSEIISAIQKGKDLIIRYEIEDEKLKEEMDKLNFKIIIPLYAEIENERKPIGLIALGRKSSGEFYKTEDVSFLETLGFQVSGIINNVLVYQNLLDLNKDLKNKVKEQTKHSREKALYLKNILEARAEFLDIASHQLRTPATVIKGALSMILDGSIKTKKQRKEFLEACFQKSIKLTDIINDILRASEMDTAEFTIDLEPVDVQEILERVYQAKKGLVNNKNIDFSLDLPSKKLPLIMSSPRYLEQIFSSLIDNALQYTKEGFVKIQARLSSGRKKFLEIRIADSGIGIPADFKDRIFDKFIRADNAVDMSVDGSGLGLFIVKKVISVHPGAEVKIEKTKVGEGTIFVVKFPVPTSVKKKK